MPMTMPLPPKEAERLAVIRAAIQEISSRPDLGQAAKERGIQALRKAEARLWRDLREPAQLGDPSKRHKRHKR